MLFDTVINEAANAYGAFDLDGKTLTLAPGTYTWTDNDFPPVYTQTWQALVGGPGEVLRLYNGGTAIINTNNGGLFNLSGGIYLEDGTLSVANNSDNPFGTADTNVTLGIVGTSYIPTVAKLNVGTSVTGPDPLIDTLKIRHNMTDVTANSSFKIRTLSMANTANKFELNIAPGQTVAVTTSYTTTAVGNPPRTTLSVLNTGRLSFESPVRLDDNTNIDLATAGATFNTLYPGNQTIPELRIGTGGIMGTLEAHASVASSTTLTITSLQGTGNISIPDKDMVVSIPGNTAVNSIPTAAAPTEGGTLKVRAPGDVQLTQSQASPATGTPRLDLDAGVIFKDMRTLSPRQFNGLHGAGTLQLDNNPTLLQLTPYLDSDFYGSINPGVPAITLNAHAVGTTQTLRSANLYNGASTFTITNGILQFANAATIKQNGMGNVAINVAAAGTLSLMPAPYNFTGTGGTPAGTLTTANGSTIVMTPQSGNCAQTTAALATVPATLRMNTASVAATLNIDLDLSQVPYAPVGTPGYIKLLSSETTPDISSHLATIATDFTITATGGTVLSKNIAGEYLYIGYTGGASSGGGGGDPTPTVVSLDMTPILNAVKSDDIFIINWVNGTTDHYNLKNQNLQINAGPEDVRSITQQGSTVIVTYNFSPIYSGAPIIVTFTDAAGNTSTYNATSKIIDGHSILDFAVAGLAAGTYTLSMSSPAGSNPFYVGPIGSFAYTPPAGAAVFTLTVNKANESSATAYATITQSGAPLSGVNVTFLLANSAGALIGTGQTKATGADGKTETVTFSGLTAGTYTVTATTDSYGSRASNVVLAGGGTDESMVSVESTTPSSPKAGDTVTVRGRLDVTRYDPSTLKAYLSDTDIAYDLQVESNGSYTLTFTMPDYDISYWFTAERLAGGTVYQSRTFPLAVYVPGKSSSGGGGCDSGLGALALALAALSCLRRRMF